MRPYIGIPPGPAFNDIAALASRICGTEIAVVNLIDEKAQWFKGRVGLDAEGLPLDVGFCPLCLASKDVVVIPDVRADPAYAHNPIATSPPYVRFYAGAPLVGRGGLRIGTLGVAHTQPKEGLSDAQKESLRALARQAVELLEARRPRGTGETEAAERYYRGVMEDLDAIVWEADYGTRRFTLVTQAASRILGYGPEEWMDDPAFLATHLHPEDRDHVLRVLDEAWAEGRDHALEFRVLHENGTPVWLHLRAYMIRDAHGAIARVRGLMMDVTERKRLENEIASARRAAAESEKLAALGSLVSGVAHEIRTPLTIIGNNAALLEARIRGRADAPDVAALAGELAPLVHEIRSGVERGNALVQDLRRFTRMDAHHRRPVDVHAAAREALQLFHAVHPREPAVQSDLQPAPPVLAHPSQVEQVVLNLVQNAFDATGGDGARVTLRTRAAEDAAIVIVEDEGPGILPDVESRMFEPLFTTKPDGTGLGLSIVARIVKEHRGAIHVDTAPGKGTRVTVRFPVDPDA